MKKSLETTYLHIQAVHNGGKPFGCKLSGLDFQTEKDFKMHIQAVHRKPFDCKLCGLDFQTEKHLQTKN